MEKFNWPDGKNFAFTVFDDTDYSTVENTSPVYDFLAEHGFRSTKSVWPGNGHTPENRSTSPGSTCEDQDYLKWVKGLQKVGFEIGHHSTSWDRSSRQEVALGFERFRAEFGSYPKSMAQHTVPFQQECEAIYWGSKRVSGFNAILYTVMTRFHNVGLSRGDVEGDRFYWGDLCKAKVKFLRNFTTWDINTLKSCPFMPYFDPQRPYVNYWFASSEGRDCNSFNRCLGEENQDRLEEEGGACIMYTHFGTEGFCENGNVNSRFRELMVRLSKKNGWFVPVSTLLDHILEVRGPHVINNRERTSLERKWLLHKLRHGST